MISLSYGVILTMPPEHERFENNTPTTNKPDMSDLMNLLMDEYKANKCGDKGPKLAKTETTCKFLEKTILDFNEVLKVSKA